MISTFFIIYTAIHICINFKIIISGYFVKMDLYIGTIDGCVMYRLLLSLISDPAKIALGIQHQLQQQQQQMLQQQQLTQLAQQCLQSYPVQLEPLLQQPIATVLNPNNVPTSAVATVANSSCREMQLEHQRQHLQAQLELEQAKTKTLQAQLQLQKQIKVK